MSIALPLMMGLALEQLIGMTDVLFLGRYGEAELAAAGVAGIYVMLVMMLGLGYTVGSQSLMSRANGAGRAEEVGAIFRQSAIFMTALGLIRAFLRAQTQAFYTRRRIHSDNGMGQRACANPYIILTLPNITHSRSSGAVASGSASRYDG